MSCAVAALQSCKLEVRDPSGQVVPGTSDSVTSLKAEVAGCYTLRVTAPLNTEYALYLEGRGPDDQSDTRAEATPLSALPVLPTLQGPSGSPLAVDAQGNFTAPQSGAYFLSVANDMRSGNAWVGGYSVQVH